MMSRSWTGLGKLVREPEREMRDGSRHVLVSIALSRVGVGSASDIDEAIRSLGLYLWKSRCCGGAVV
jgi:hypothetical protein